MHGLPKWRLQWDVKILSLEHSHKKPYKQCFIETGCTCMYMYMYNEFCGYFYFEVYIIKTVAAECCHYCRQHEEHDWIIEYIVNLVSNHSLIIIANLSYLWCGKKADKGFFTVVIPIIQNQQKILTYVQDMYVAMYTCKLH